MGARAVILWLALVGAELTRAGESGPGPAIDALVRSLSAGDRCLKEHEDARRVHRFDIDHDGDQDALVLFTLEGAGCGNHHALHMALFRNERDRFKHVANEVVGGKWGAHVDYERVTFDKGRIVLRTLRHADDDAACCPSIAGQAVYVFRDGKLVQERGAKP